MSDATIQRVANVGLFLAIIHFVAVVVCTVCGVRLGEPAAKPGFYAPIGPAATAVQRR